MRFRCVLISHSVLPCNLTDYRHITYHYKLNFLSAFDVLCRQSIRALQRASLIRSYSSHVVCSRSATESSGREWVMTRGSYLPIAACGGWHLIVGITDSYPELRVSAHTGFRLRLYRHCCHRLLLCYLHAYCSMLRFNQSCSSLEPGSAL